MSVFIDIDGNIAVITLNRPDALNALAMEDLVELNECLVAARDDQTVRVIVITGAGDRSFCTGADLKNTLPPNTSFVNGFLSSRGIAHEVGNYVRLFDFSTLAIDKPIIAAINGYCLGGGLEIALQCDIRVASAESSFGLTEPVVGSIPAVGGVPLLLRAIPSAIAMRMLLTGERINAQRANEVGLVSDIWKPDELVNKSLELAYKISSNGPLAVQMIKRLSRDSANMPLSEAVRLNELYWGVLRDTEDRVEGRKAFADKRKPIFLGK